MSPALTPEERAIESRRLLGVDFKIDESGEHFVVTDDGDIEVAVGRNCLQENLYLLMYNPTGQRPRHPTWGIGLEKYVSESMTTGQKAELIQHIRIHLLRDSRVKKINDIKVSMRAEGSHKCDIEVELEPIDEAGPMSLVFPFDLEVS